MKHSISMCIQNKRGEKPARFLEGVVRCYAIAISDLAQTVGYSSSGSFYTVVIWNDEGNIFAQFIIGSINIAAVLATVLFSLKKMKGE